MSTTRFFRKSKRPRLNEEDKIKNFILRNSKNGYFTRVSTLSNKFEIPQSKVWEIVGTLLADNSIEAYHDGSGQIKLCGPGQIFRLLKKNFSFKKTQNKKFI